MPSPFCPPCRRSLPLSRSTGIDHGGPSGTGPFRDCSLAWIPGHPRQRAQPPVWIPDHPKSRSTMNGSCGIRMPVARTRMARLSRLSRLSRLARHGTNCSPAKISRPNRNENATAFCGEDNCLLSVAYEEVRGAGERRPSCKRRRGGRILCSASARVG
ncbi:hypothetical protein LX36DRAFT_197706 [Colletotrichum falcatum]|nr:hypothetical protein LX36DRAFT_197706 [Colletotrichum falcatum]